MKRDQLSRKLAVILHADVVGSTALVQLDETLAHQRIKNTFRRISETINNHDGIAHEIRGDALVAEFARGSDAVSASLAFQAANTAYNEKLADNIRPGVRVGIAMGEVVIADNTVTGEGVVLAQRLEQIAEPGGTCIQGAVYETIPKRLPFDYENLGERQVKGFNEPVRVYAVVLRPGAPIPEPEMQGHRDAGAPDLADKPSIAVLPFTNMSDDPEQEYFSDGITEDIITALQAWHYFPVVSRNSSFVYKGRNVSIKQVAKDLGASYILEGSVRKSGSRLRISAQLIEASTDLHLWAERYDRQLEDIFQLQDEITYRIVATVTPELEKVEANRISTKHPHNLDAWDYYQRGSSLLFEFSKQGNDQARKMFLAAIEIDPRYSKAHTGLAYSYHRDLFWSYADDRLQWIERFLQVARDAVKHDDTDSSAHLVLGYAYLWDGQFDLAIAAEQRAVTLHPGNAFAHVALGEALDLSGDPRQAIPHMQAGIEMNENDPRIHTFIGALARTWINARDYQKGEYWARKALERRDDYPQAQFYLATSLGHQGRIGEGESVLKSCHHLLPGWALAYKQERDNEHFREGLRKAGWSGSISGDLTQPY